MSEGIVNGIVAIVTFIWFDDRKNISNITLKNFNTCNWFELVVKQHNYKKVVSTCKGAKEIIL
jgi:hypothetical protein